MAFDGLKNMLGAITGLGSPKPGVYDLARKAKSLLTEGDEQAANVVLLEALEKYPGHSSLEDINHFIGQRKLQDALGSLKQAVEACRRAYLETARAWADTDNYQKAMEFLIGAFRRFPECSDLHMLLGEIYLRRYLEETITDDGKRAAESLETAYQLDRENLRARRYLAGLYARIGWYQRASEHLKALTGSSPIDDEDRHYLAELTDHCATHAAESDGKNLKDCLEEVFERRGFAVDCGKWAWPVPPTYARRDPRSCMVPFPALEVTARKCVELPGIIALVVQNRVRSETYASPGFTRNVLALETAVRDLATNSAESCYRMSLGHARECLVHTGKGLLALQMFADTWVGLLFAEDVNETHARTVIQQFLDALSERLGEIHERNS